MSLTGMMKNNLDFEQPVLIFGNDCENHSYLSFTSTRHGGISPGEYASFNLGEYCGDHPDNVRKNRDVLCRILDVDPAFLFVPHQIHGDEVVVVDNEFLSSYNSGNKQTLPDCDALISSLDNVCLGVTTADCVPVVFYSDDPSVIAVAHAGWRGTGQKIVNKVIAEMYSKYSCNPEKIHVKIFSCISRDVYEVGKEVVQAMEGTGIDMSDVAIPGKSPGRYYLDLVLANRRLLTSAGVPDGHIEVIGDCTYTRSKDLFSARRQGLPSGRILSGILKRKMKNMED